MKNVLKPGSISPTSMITVQLEKCGGLISEPPIEGRCKQVIRKIPETLCGMTFIFRSSDKEVCKVYCERHRYCFFPLTTGGINGRCPNLRRQMDKPYCKLHVEQEKECGLMVKLYKKMCGLNPMKERCKAQNDPEMLESKGQTFDNCFKARGQHHRFCIHEDVQSLGHRHFLQTMNAYRNECEKMLWHDAPDWPDPLTDSESENEDDEDDEDDEDNDDIFYDTSEV
jgi:hypothetical protein